MIFLPTTRGVLGAVFFILTGILATPGTARAVSEFCPAHSGGFNRIGDGASTLYSYTVDAEGPRTVSGAILVDTASGWFRVPFVSATVAPRQEHWKDDYVEYTRMTYASPPLYVRFPQPERLIDSFVADASSVGDEFFGWDTKGDSRCAPPAGLGLLGHGKSQSAVVLLNPRTDLDVPPPMDAIVQTASATSAPGSIDCAVPFANATVKTAADLQYPVGFVISTQVLVEVLVDASGVLADEWVFAPSSYKAFDDAALESARKSIFTPGVAFCQPAPGKYLFRAEFNP